jgi:hypothetical protein
MQVSTLILSEEAFLNTRIGAALLLTNITDTINMLSGMGLSIPVGNADAGSYFNTHILEAVSYGVSLGIFALVASDSCNRWPTCTRGSPTKRYRMLPDGRQISLLPRT